MKINTSLKDNKSRQTHVGFKIDIFGERFLKAVLRSDRRPYDAVVANPEFESVLATLLIGSKLIEHNQSGRLYFLLPKNFFSNSQRRRMLFSKTNLQIEQEFKLGRWNYYPDKLNTKKLTEDSLFILKNIRANTEPNMTFKTTIITDWNE